MAKIKPSEREKKRYLVFLLSSKFTFEQQVIKETIAKTIKKYLGEFGFQRCRLLFIKNLYDKDSQKGIIRVTLKMTEETKKALSMVKMIDNKKCSVQIIGVSGILKKAKYKFLKTR